METWKLFPIFLIFLSGVSFSFQEPDIAERDQYTFEQRILNGHNMYRSLHGAPPLQLNRYLCNVAQEWANYLAYYDLWFHRPGNPYGENLYKGYGTTTPGKDAVDMWYNEVILYNYGNPVFGLDTGHFTQMVWKETNQLGVARAVSPNSGWTYIVANYYPFGNVQGQFSENVVPASTYYAKSYY